MTKTCASCDAPLGDDLLPTALHGCWWHGQYRERLRVQGMAPAEIDRIMDDIQRSGADLPCWCAKDAKESEERERRVYRRWIIGFLLLVAALAFAWSSQ